MTLALTAHEIDCANMTNNIECKRNDLIAQRTSQHRFCMVIAESENKWDYKLADDVMNTNRHFFFRVVSLLTPFACCQSSFMGNIRKCVFRSYTAWWYSRCAVVFFGVLFVLLTFNTDWTVLISSERTLHFCANQRTNWQAIRFFCRSFPFSCHSLTTFSDSHAPKWSCAASKAIV